MERKKLQKNYERDVDHDAEYVSTPGDYFAKHREEDGDVPSDNMVDSSETNAGLKDTISHAGKGPKGYRRSSSRIHEEVCETLAQDPDVDASDMEVTLNDSKITLTGSVPDKQMKIRAERIAKSIRGVEEVENLVEVRKKEDETRPLSGKTPSAQAPHPGLDQSKSGAV